MGYKIEQRVFPFESYNRIQGGDYLKKLFRLQTGKMTPCREMTMNIPFPEETDQIPEFINVLLENNWKPNQQRITFKELL